MENLKNLIGLLKVTSQNIKILHRHVKSDNFFGVHEKLGEYYEKIDDVEDAIVEICLGLGGEDTSILDVSDKFKHLENKDYTRDEAFKLCQICFNKIIELFDAAKEEVPDFIKSEFESYQYWFWLEANYKLPRIFE